MYNIIFDEIVNVLNNEKLVAPILNIHLPKRAKFERYLQTILANNLLSNYKDTEIEKEYPNNNHSHTDIYANDTYIELKTPNTNYRMEGVKNLTRPITDNIQSIIKDINKLRNAKVNGVIAFVLFPINETSNYSEHINKIKNELGTSNYKETVVNNMYVFSAEV